MYSLTTGFDLTSTITHLGSIDISGLGTLAPTSLIFNPDGTTMFLLAQSSDKVYEYVLTTAFDLTTAVNVDSHAVGGGDQNNPKSIAFNDDGDKMFIAGDYLNINSSYSRIQGNMSERRDTIDFAINFISNRETQYSLSLAGDENAEAKLGISKNIYGFDLGFNANQSISNNSNQEAELMLTYNY